MNVAGTASPQSKFDHKLSKLLRSAAEVFADQGYDRASIRAVAQHAGLSVPGLYHYVRSKEELLFLIQFHVFDGLVRQFEADAASCPDPEERLKLFISNHLRRFVGSLDELVVCSREIDRLEGDMRQQVEARQREYFSQALRIFIDLGQAHGAPESEARTATLALFGSINWIHTWYRPDGRASVDSLAEDFVRLYLRGFLPAES